MQSKGRMRNTKTRHGAHTGSCTERRSNVPCSEGNPATSGKVNKAAERERTHEKYAVEYEGMQVTTISAHRHARNRMAMTTRSRCRRRLTLRPLPLLHSTV